MSMSRYAGLLGRRRARAAEDGPDENDRPEAEDEEDETSAESTDDDDDDAEEGEDKPSTDARISERQRVASITGHKVAANMPNLAGYLAMDTDLSAKAAGKILNAAADDIQAAPEQSSADRVFAHLEANNPDVGGGGDSGATPKMGLAAFTKREIDAGNLN